MPVGLSAFLTEGWIRMGTEKNRRKKELLIGTRVFDVIGVIILIAAIIFSIYMDKGGK